jgi:hypothetical protein
MKNAIVIQAIAILSIWGCTNYKKLNGNFVYGNSIELRLTKNPKYFEYFIRGEMGLLRYSTGEWRLNKNKIYLTGFDSNNINILKIESAATNSSNKNGTQIKLFYHTDKVPTFIKSVLSINDSNIYKIVKDTCITLKYKVETLQVMSYLSCDGLLSSSPTTDTLYSQKINFDQPMGEIITLKFSVNSQDFVRTKLTDTLTVKNGRNLMLNKIKLKKTTQ